MRDKNNYLTFLIIIFFILAMFQGPVVGKEDTAPPVQEDTTPPEFQSYSLSPRIFTPDGDGIDDVITLNAEADVEVSWIVYIKDETGKAGFGKISGGKGKTLNLKWDGSAEGAVLPDGKYSITLLAKGSDGGSEETQLVEIKNSPGKELANEIGSSSKFVFSLNVSPTEFSPNGDGMEDSVKIYVDASMEVGWILTVINAQIGDAILEQYVGRGKTLETAWDGKDQNGELVPSGRYILYVTAEKDDGSLISKAVPVDAKESLAATESYGNEITSEELRFDLSSSSISPDGDGFDDVITLNAEADVEVSWIVYIKDETGKAGFGKISGGKGKTLNLKWDGSAEGAVLPDGKYSITLLGKGIERNFEATKIVEVIKSPNKEKGSQVKKSNSLIHIQTARTSKQLTRGDVSKATIGILNHGNADISIDLSTFSNPESGGITFVPDTVGLEIPANGEVFYDIDIVVSDWIDGGHYEIGFKLFENGEETQSVTLPRLITADIEKPNVLIDSTTLLIARSDVLVDFVSASSYAYPNSIPIIKINRKGLTSGDIKKIEDYVDEGIEKAVIVGGPSAVSYSQENVLEGLGLFVNRVGGSNRYETSAKIALLWENALSVVIANGMEENSYLQGQKIAAERGVPLLLTSENTLPASTIQALRTLGVENVFVQSAVGSEIISEIEELGIKIEKS